MYAPRPNLYPATVGRDKESLAGKHDRQWHSRQSKEGYPYENRDGR